MAFSPEQLNFFKFSFVVLDEFPIALHQVFIYMWDTLVASTPGVPKWNDSVTVLNIFLAKEGGAKKVAMLNKSSKEWDCAALFKATLFSQTFAMPDGTGVRRTLHELYVRPRALPPGAFHSSVTSPTGNSAETHALALDQLRLLRNTFCHQVTTRKIEKATFDSYIKLAKDAFTALGQDKSKLDEIGNLGEEEFPTSRLQKLEDELKKEKDAAIKFKQIDDHLHKIQSQVKDLNIDVTDVKTLVEDVGLDVRDILSDVKDVMTDTTDVRTRVENVGSDVKDVKTQVGCVTSIGKNLKADVESVKMEVKDVKTRLTEIQSNVQDLKTKVVDERKTMKAEGYSTPKSWIPNKKVHFVGRERESEEILSRFKDKDTRLINVCGPPAFGKTWLITEVAHQLETPVYYASLRGMTTIDDLISRLLSIFGDRNSAFQIKLQPCDWLIDCLEQVQGPFVLLLDDADELLDCGDVKVRNDVFVLIGRILQCNDVKLLIASYESLDGEIDDHAIHVDRVGVLDEVASVELVKTLLPDISDSDCNKIVRVGGQVPLVMKLICSTVKEPNFSVDKLLQALKDSPLLEVLDNKRISNIINTCYERLATQDRNTFVSLAAISTGCFGLEEARSVLNLKTIQRTERRIKSLKRKSLIDCSEDFQHCTIHSLFRSFIEEKRQTHQETEDLFKKAQRHHYIDNLSIFEANNEKYLTGRSNEALAAFQSRREKIISSFRNGTKDDELYDKVVELLSTGELYLHTVLINEEALFKAIYDAALEEARRRKKSVDRQNLLAAKSFEMWGWFSPQHHSWDFSLYSDGSCVADCPVKLLCYHGIHQILCGKLNEGMLSLNTCVERLSERCDERVLKSLALGLLAHCQEREQGNKSGPTSEIENCISLLFSRAIDDEVLCLVRARLLIISDVGTFEHCEMLFKTAMSIAEIHGRCHADGIGQLHLGKWLTEWHQLYERCTTEAANSFMNLLGLESVTTVPIASLPNYEVMQDYEVVVQCINSLSRMAFAGLKPFGDRSSSQNMVRAFTVKSSLFLIKSTIESNLKSHEMVPGIDFKELAVTYEKFGVLLDYVGDLSGAIASYEQAIRLRNEHAGNPVSIAASLIRIGFVYLKMNSLDEAGKAFQRALELRKSSGLDNSENFLIYNLLAVIHQFRGNLSEALGALHETSVLREKHLDENLLTAATLQYAGAIHTQTGDFEAAQEEIKKALEMLTKLGHTGTSFALCCLNLACILLISECQTDLVLALEFCQKAVHIFIDSLGGSCFTAKSLYLEGQIHKEMNNNQSAIEAFQRASRMMSNLLGDHEDTADSFYGLGISHYDQGEYEAAVKAFQEAARIRSNILGGGGGGGGVELVEIYRLTALTYYRLGVAQCRLEDLRGALASLQEASRLRREALVEDQLTDEILQLINLVCEDLSVGELDCD